MKNFVFYNPVKLIFGKGTISQLADEIPSDKRILITYGSGSIKRNGVYAQVIQALAGYTIFEFGGIEPNPQYKTLMKAVDLIKEKDIDFVLAVGGGSVIDGTKFIVAAVNYVGDPWEFVGDMTGKHIQTALPFGTILTLPAAGSEMNAGAVISRAETGHKLAFSSKQVFPKFSILDPEMTYTLPAKQTANGIIDTFIHTTEQYLTYKVNSPMQDRWAEGILLTLIDEAPKVTANAEDYEARANIMLCSTMALNGLLGMGVPQDWATHLIGHELTAKYGLDHGITLAIVLPAVMQVMRESKKQKLLQYANRVFGISRSDADQCIDMAIVKTRMFFESLGVKTHLADYNIGEECVAEILEQLKNHNMTALGENSDIDLQKSATILRLCL